MIVDVTETMVDLKTWYDHVNMREVLEGKKVLVMRRTAQNKVLMEALNMTAASKSIELPTVVMVYKDNIGLTFYKTAKKWLQRMLSVGDNSLCLYCERHLGDVGSSMVYALYTLMKRGGEMKPIKQKFGESCFIIPKDLKPCGHYLCQDCSEVSKAKLMDKSDEYALYCYVCCDQVSGT